MIAEVTSESFGQKNVKKFGAVHIMMICVALQCSLAIKLKLKEFGGI